MHAAVRPAQELGRAAALPGQVSEQIGRPASSSTTPTIDQIRIQPLLAGTVRTGHHQPMQHADEHGTFQGEAEPAILGQLFDHAAATALFPEPAEQDRGADAQRDAAINRPGRVTGEQHGGLGEART